MHLPDKVPARGDVHNSALSLSASSARSVRQVTNTAKEAMSAQPGGSEHCFLNYFAS